MKELNSKLNLNLLKVYEYRSLAAQDLPQIYGYFSPMVFRVFFPFILLFAVYHRKWLIAGLAITGSVMIFALTNHKGPLFYPFLVLGIYYVMRSRRGIQLLLASYILVIFVSLAASFIGDSNIVGALFFRRVDFVPAHLNFIYYDFFSTHPHTMLAQSKLTFGLVEYPYQLDSSHLIGHHYYDNELVGANTGWLGTGYMNFGFVGLLIYAFIIGLLLSMVDMLSKGKEIAVSGAILYPPFQALFLGTDLPTAMLTHGLLLAMFLTWSCQLKGCVMSKPHKTIASFFKAAVRRCNDSYT